MIIIRAAAKASLAPEILGFITTTGSSTTVANLPDIPVGETWVMIIGYGFNTFTPPAGWIVNNNNQVASHRTAVLSRVRQSGDGLTQSLAFGATTSIIKAYGISNAGSIRVNTTSTNTNATAHPTLANTATIPNSLILRSAFNLATGTRSYAWGSGTTPESDILHGTSGILATANRLSSVIEQDPDIVATSSQNIGYATQSIVIGPKLDQGVTVTQRGTLAANQTVTVNTFGELGPLTAGSGAVVVGNALQVQGSGRVIITARLQRSSSFGDQTIQLYVNGVFVNELTPNGGTVATLTVETELESGSLLTMQARGTSSSGNTFTTGSYIEIAPV